MLEINALPKAADRYLKYRGLIFPLRRSICSHAPFPVYAKKPDKDRHLSLRLIRLPFL